jgi:carbon storage regulator
MLVLSRKPGEQIIIGDVVVVTVLGVSHGLVRLGIEAPARVNIRRSEVRPRSTHRAITAAAVGAGK